ncbi:MAG: glutamate 5-kinase [Candidatus Omnitrophica bacterium]|nr:glutamate 5-kinase [Candidatus Omnitrophota bacterium]
MQLSERKYKRIVIKVGSSLFCSKENSIDLLPLAKIATSVVNQMRVGYEVVIVSSGAIALGMSAMDLCSRPKDLSMLQAAAAIGQNRLMDCYSEEFEEASAQGQMSKIWCAQVLLTRDDFTDRKRYLNAKNTLLRLLKLGAVPIVNENDTISTEEIKFGDNDRLSALVATLISADLLIIFSDVDGLLDNNKEIVKFVPEITAQIKSLACPTTKKTCVGGMITKLEAAKIATDSGIPCVIAHGNKLGYFEEITKDPFSGGAWTVFAPGKGTLVERKRWIAFGTKPKAHLVVDDGARKALLNKKSLLAVGIVSFEGAFAQGDVVSVVDAQGKEIARGKARVSSKQLETVLGKRFDREIIHRNDIAIMA